MTRGDVVEVDLPTNTINPGREQVGRRPALIIHEDASISTSPVVMVIPFTSNVGALRFPHAVQISPSLQNGLAGTSVAMVFQLRAIDKTRIGRRLGKLEIAHIKTIEQETRKMLSI